MQGNLGGAQLLPIGLNDLFDASTSTYIFKSPSSLSMKDQAIALQKLSMFRSWPNISWAKYGNSRYSYKWIDGTVVPIDMPDGIYTIDDISEYLHYIMKSNLHYMIDSSGPEPVDVFFLSFVTNPTYYRIQINFTVVPAPTATLTIPVGATWAASVGKCPQITISSLGFDTNSFGSIIGFNTYVLLPTIVTADVQQLGDFTPTAEPVSQILVQTSVVSNQNSSTPQLLFAFRSNGYSSGDPIEIDPNEFAWVETTQVSNIQEIRVSLTDQNNVPLFVQDPSVTIVLYIKPKTTLSIK